MDLTTENRLKIIEYLHGIDALKVMPPKMIASHLDMLDRNKQFEAVEGTDGKLIYAWAWWMLTERNLEDYKNGLLPKRYNRGRNMVGFFGMNEELDVPAMLRVIKKNMKLFNARTFTVYTTRGKWLTFNAKDREPRDRKKRKLAKVFADLMKGEESWAKC